MWGISANAEVLIYDSTTPVQHADLLDLSDQAGFQPTQFFTTSTTFTKLTILFSAVCAVKGNENSFVDIDILVNGNAWAPSHIENHFCSGNRTADWDGLASYATVAVGQLNLPGTYSLQIRTKGNTPAADRWIQAMSLAVIR